MAVPCRQVKPFTPRTGHGTFGSIAIRSQLSGRRRRLLVGGDPGEMPVKRSGPVDSGRRISRNQPAGVPSGAHHTVVAPHLIRLTIQKVDGLYLTRPKYGDQEIADRSNVLDANNDAVRRSFDNTHSIDRSARKVVNLFKVQNSSLLHL